MEEKKINKSIAFSIVAILLLVIVVAGATYAYFRAVGQTAEQEVTTANLTMGFAAGEWINTEGLMPISDAQITTGGAAELPFTVTNTGDEHMNITVSLSDIIITDGLKDVDFRWGLFNTTTGNGLAYGIFSDLDSATELTLYRDTIIDATDPDTTNSYTLRIWIHDNGAAQDSLMGQSLKAKVKVTGEAVDYTPEECFTFNSSTGVIYGTWGDLDTTDSDGDGVPDSMTPGYDYENPNCPSDVVVPRTIGGVSVTQIGDWAFGGYDTGGWGVGITSLILPDSITKINNGISGNDFTHLTVPEGVTGFSWATLADIPLKTIYLPETVTALADMCSPEGCSFDTIILPGSLKTVSSSAMTYSSTKNVILMEGITTIGEMEAISGTFESIEIPSSVTSVGLYGIVSNNLKTIIVRGKDSLDDFTDATGLTTSGGLPEGVTIEFRP